MGLWVYYVQLNAIAVDEVCVKLFSYVVARDYGFAPNPFYGVCTLATCKPRIRSAAQIGDWVVGTGSSAHCKKGFLIYAMCITEIITFNQYWNDQRFQQKKPNLRGSKKQAFGDNIYFKKPNGHWQQQDSHHSYECGKPNLFNIKNDTQTEKILISTDYAYWGDSGPQIPNKFRNFKGFDLCAGRNHKSQFPESLVKQFVDWFYSLDAKGYLGVPLDWSKTA